ncbi:MAG: YfhO family protein [Bryobacteraceae bacterium]|nr:YfhO family protein [Bryobacteraceae bacterium]
MRVALVSLLLTWAFFFEYIPPTKSVRFWSDIEGYHYPLLDYAHKAVWQGRIPLWDPSIYCGVPYAGNIQAGLFYPPNWLLFVANAKMPEHLRGSSQGPGVAGMRFTSVEILAFLHLWLAFVFTYHWLRTRNSSWIAATLGATVFACGGYPLSQLNHLGVICGYAWMPFALWGIEQANQSRRPKSLWKVAVGAALCLTAGYPPTFVGFALICLLYAAATEWRKRLFTGTCAALAFSLLLAAIQLLPALEAARLKQPEIAFGGALPFGNEIYGSMLVPNWFDQNRTQSGVEASAGDYLYLGVPFLFGVGWLMRRGWFRGAGPALLLVSVPLFIAADPTGIVLRTIEHMPIVPDVLRRYNLLPGVVLGAALLASSAVEDFLARRSRYSLPRASAVAWGVLSMLWAVYILTNSQFLTSWASAVYPSAMLVLTVWGLLLLRSERRLWIAVALALSIVGDFHSFGTNRRFSAVDGSLDSGWSGDARVGGTSLNGLDDEVYHEVLRHPGFRVALTEGPHSTDLRHYNLATLQGFDPFLTDQYKAAVERFGPFRTNRLFDVDPFNENMLRHFGVRWVLSRNENALVGKLTADPRFRKLPPGASFYVVFEYLGAQPAWRFEGDVALGKWEPEHRTFQVFSSSGGRFVLVEQFFPGWSAKVDGKDTPIERADGTFQSIPVPAGRHTIEFAYIPQSLYLGACISLSASLVLVLLVSRTHQRSVSALTSLPPG